MLYSRYTQSAPRVQSEMKSTVLLQTLRSAQVQNVNYIHAQVEAHVNIINCMNIIITRKKYIYIYWVSAGGYSGTCLSGHLSIPAKKERSRTFSITTIQSTTL